MADNTAALVKWINQNGNNWDTIDIIPSPNSELNKTVFNDTSEVNVTNHVPGVTYQFTAIVKSGSTSSEYKTTNKLTLSTALNAALSRLRPISAAQPLACKPLKHFP